MNTPTDPLEADIRKIKDRIVYNQHDMGELGEFIRTKYVMNIIDEMLPALIHTREQQARVDEVNKIPYWGTPYDTDVFGYEKLFRDNRLATLNKEVTNE